MPAPNAAGTYAFRPLGPADLALVAGWLEQPHVAQWWASDGEDRIAEIRAALADPSTEPFVVVLDGRPIGYIQVYDPHLEEAHPYADQPPGTLGIDQFIGEPDLVGHGHGPRLVAAFVERLFQAGASRVLTDPDPANRRAIHAYEKAGFVRDREQTGYGGERVLLMVRSAPARPASASRPLEISADGA